MREGTQETHTHTRTPVSLTGCLGGVAWTQLTVTVLDQTKLHLGIIRSTALLLAAENRTPLLLVNKVFTYGTIKWFVPFYAFVMVGLCTLGLRSHNSEVQGHCSTQSAFLLTGGRTLGCDCSVIHLFSGHAVMMRICKSLNSKSVCITKKPRPQKPKQKHTSSAASQMVHHLQ